MDSLPLRDRQRSYSPIIVYSIFLGLAFFAVALRLWARRMKKTLLGRSDYAILSALFFTSAFCVVSIIAITLGGVGKHEQDLSKSATKTLLKTFFAAEPLWVASCTAVKISILCLYLAIFPTRPFHFTVYAVMGLVSCYCLGFIIRTFAICHPIEYNWDKDIHGSCGDGEKSSIAGGISNMILDIIVIVLPMPMLWRLQMAAKKKMIVMGIFGLGIFICIISILRLVVIIRLDYEDLSYSVELDGIWTFLEPALGIINACLPVLQPVLSRFLNFSILKWAKNVSTGKTALRQRPSPSSPLEEKANDSRKFKRLDEHLYPLTNMSTTQMQVTTGRGSDEGLDLDLESQYATVKD